MAGRRLGAYQLVRCVGTGGMGAVYEAIHGQLGRRVAVKVMHPRAGDADGVNRFLREAKAAAQIRHPNVVTVFDVGQDDDVSYLVMDFLEGPNLADYLRERAPLSVERIVDIFVPIASAIATAHDASVVHRDLKPSNILLTSTQSETLLPVVLDFGISRVLTEQERATHSDAFLGTAAYLSPEQARNAKHASPASDQYAIGVMLYECATGQQPFSGKGAYEILHAIVTAAPAHPSALNPAIPAEFAQIIERAMHRDPAKRFPSVKALGSALLTFAGRRIWSIWGNEYTGVKDGAVATDVTAREQRPSAAPRRPTSRTRGAVLALGAVVVGAALGRASFSWIPWPSDDERANARVAREKPAPITPDAKLSSARTTLASPLLVNRAPEPAIPPMASAHSPPAASASQRAEQASAPKRAAAARVRALAQPARPKKGGSKPRTAADIDYEVGANGVPILE
jgi:serine/threonine-protein kinase